jgi:hypothetical protein
LTTVLDQAVARVSEVMAERVRSDEDAISRLEAIPGVGRAVTEVLVAEVLVAEIGADVGRFPTAQHLAF